MLLQVEGSGYAVVGERVPLTFVLSAPAALQGALLAVSAGYREGLGGPALFTAPPTGGGPPWPASSVEFGTRVQSSCLIDMQRD